MGHPHTGPDRLAERFEGHRRHLWAIAYRMLGSASDADDAVQETWMRLSRVDADRIDDLGAWLTTVVGNICLNQLRSRRRRPEDPLEAHVPDPIVASPDGTDPEAALIVADAVGLALMAVLDTLTPAERVAFVLHDVFGMRFDEIATIVGRSSAATRQLASRGRRRVRDVPVPDVDLRSQWVVVDRFLAASRAGDLEGVLAVLDPDVVLVADGGPERPRLAQVVRGAAAVAANAMTFRNVVRSATRALVNGLPGGVGWTPEGRPFAVLAMTVSGGRIIRIDVLADPDRLARLDLGPVGRR